MATDFNRVLYHVIEEHVKRQVGEEEFKKLNKYQWRAHMSNMMEHFARALVSIVVQVSAQHAKVISEARAAADKAAGDEKPKCDHNWPDDGTAQCCGKCHLARPENYAGAATTVTPTKAA
jgi:hypothetical protein